MYLKSFENYKENLFLGTREKKTEEYVDEETKETKTRTVFGKYMYMTYAQAEEFSTGVANFVINKDLCPKKEMDGRNIRVLGLFSKNREEWALTDIACVLANIVSVPIYDTLGVNGISHIIDQTEMETLCCSDEKIGIICSLKKEGKIPTLKNIILYDVISEEIKSKCTDAGLEIFNLLVIAEEGGKLDVDHEYPTADDIYSILYTSGTTGDPKGVISTHVNIASTLGGVDLIGVDISEKDVHFSYLPLAHIFDRLLHALIAYSGARIGYYQGDILKIKDDLAALRPTIFASVPRLLNRFYDLMMAGINQQTGIKRKLVDWGIASKTSKIEKSGNFNSMFYDKIVFKKFRDILGGRVRLMITGSAPIAPETLKFLKVAFSCAIFEAYGQTETTGGSFFTSPYDNTSGHVGGPTPNTEFKLVDVPEMDYYSTDEINGVKCPRGEICIRGPGCFPGYFKDPKKTEETIDGDEFVHTGDVGQIIESGALKVIDRKKNIFKLSQGEYIAAEKLENIFASIDLIKQIFIYGDSLQAFLVAVVVPDKDEVKKWNDGNIDDYEELVRSEKFTKAVTEAIEAKRKDQKLNGLEVPKKLYVSV
eukprot:CAMPEP_0168355008 /NCGR_PEP_ID=MMETSP0213-20121227/24265_1 /TAXON_ID=151035 /ORGANISM="Euplotes harpa, Strain FSP1.4" /LENGTH=593 /DNA_ID=CAMNT_0008367077 /DNA_START=129 /DNA_END=1907 /DNA_ORIENTATION=+